jgi:MoaA/NifB/PqqE/SkfB family radical SAM enzyme
MGLPVTIPTSTWFNYKTIHIEVSSKCTLKCPRCPRTELELDRLNQEISMTDFQSGFPLDVLQHIDHIIFCGDLGDPIYATDFLEIVKYIKQKSSIRLRIITNGSYKKSEWWNELGSLLNHNDMVTFSVDGWNNDSNNLYRVNSDFDSIVIGIRSLKQSSDCTIRWSAIYFSFNQDHMDKIRAMASSLGCHQFQTVKSSKFGGRYLSNGTDTLLPRDELVAESLIYETKVETLHDNKYDAIVVGPPRQSHAWAQCMNWKKDLFVGVDGLVVPCPWFNNGYQSNPFVDQHRAKLSIRNRSFFEIIGDKDLWDQLHTSFEHSPLEICKFKCKNAKQ